MMLGKRKGWVALLDGEDDDDGMMVVDGSGIGSMRMTMKATVLMRMR